MKKSERLNSMMIYLMDKDSFNLSDLISRFNISRSTALRDIASLEELGVPIYSEPGRYGGYRILENSSIPPISFTNDEIFALYFSMLTLESYESTPFHLYFSNLKNKFTESISKTNAKKLNEMERVLRFESSRHYNESPFLKKLVYSAIDKEVLKISYMQKDKMRDRCIQVAEIMSRYGEWYCTAFDFDRSAMRVFRCDRIKAVETCNSHEPIDFSGLSHAHVELRQKNEKYFDFKVEIDGDGVNIFRKENYPNMLLESDQGKNFIKGYYGEHEEEFMAKYLLNYGKTIKSIYPNNLKEALSKLCHDLLKHYEDFAVSDKDADIHKP